MFLLYEHCPKQDFSKGISGPGKGSMLGCWASSVLQTAQRWSPASCTGQCWHSDYVTVGQKKTKHASGIGERPQTLTITPSSSFTSPHSQTKTSAFGSRPYYFWPESLLKLLTGFPVCIFTPSSGLTALSLVWQPASALAPGHLQDSPFSWDRIHTTQHPASFWAYPWPTLSLISHHLSLPLNSSHS